jgi:hypothetical protein
MPFFIGHTHAHGMVELGYLLEPADLKSNPNILDKIILEKSSIQSLAGRHAHHTKPHHLMRKVFGDSISGHSNISVVPSSMDPEPDNVSYFSGGYTTQNYHYKADKNDKGLDVIQIEIPKEFRHIEESRRYLVKSMVLTVISILDTYYISKSKL